MLTYLAVLALGLIGINKLHIGLLILQERADRASAISSNTIITNNPEHCNNEFATAASIASGY